jgi:hypothetical protein
MVDQVEVGASFAVTYTLKKEIVGNFLPEAQIVKSKRKLRILDEKAQAAFNSDYQMTEEMYQHALYSRHSRIPLILLAIAETA